MHKVSCWTGRGVELNYMEFWSSVEMSEQQSYLSFVGRMSKYRPKKFWMRTDDQYLLHIGEGLSVCVANCTVVYV